MRRIRPTSLAFSSEHGANAPASQTALELKIKGRTSPSSRRIRALERALLRSDAPGRPKADALLVGAADEWNLVYHQGYERVRATRAQNRKVSLW